MAYTPHIAAILAAAAWGIEYATAKTAMRELTPGALGFWMYAACGVALAIRSAAQAETRRAWRQLADRRLLGLCVAIAGGGVLLNVCALYGIRTTTAANAAILARTDIFFTLVLGSLVWREAVSRRAPAWIALMVVGVCLVMRLIPTRLRLHSAGDLLMLVSAFVLSINGFLIKGAVSRLPGSVVACVNCFGNALFFAVLARVERAWPFAILSHSPDVVAATFVSAALAVVFFLGYYRALRTLPVWEVRLFLLGVPAFTLPAGWLLHSQIPGGWQFVGIACIIAAAAGQLLDSRPRGVEAG